MIMPEMISGMMLLRGPVRHYAQAVCGGDEVLLAAAKDIRTQIKGDDELPPPPGFEHR